MSKVALVLKGGPKADTTRQFEPNTLEFTFPKSGENQIGVYRRPNTRTHYMEWQGWQPSNARP